MSALPSWRPLTFRRVTRNDFALLGTWLAEPHVSRWWNHEVTPEAIERDFGAAVDGAEPSQDHLVLLDGEPVGLIQYCRYADYPEDAAELARIVDLPDDAVCIDYLIGDPHLIGRGLGTAMITAFCDRVWQVSPTASCIVVPVVSANPVSWKTLLRCGFRLAGRGDLEPDNPVDDPSHEVLRLDRP
jgi:aminoglycoside 6'-N-acetyltransferase